MLLIPLWVFLQHPYCFFSFFFSFIFFLVKVNCCLSTYIFSERNIIDCYSLLAQTQSSYPFDFFSFFFLAALGLCCCTRAFSSCSKQGLLFIAVQSLVVEHGLQACGLQQLWLVGSRAQAQQLWCTGLVASRHVGSSRTRARTRVPCIGRQILNQGSLDFFQNPFSFDTQSIGLRSLASDSTSIMNGQER